MQITYHLTTEDFTEHQVYIASKSALILKKMRRNQIYITLLYVATGLWFGLKEHQYFVAGAFALVATLWYFFYPGYSIKKYKKYLDKFVLENYQNRIGKDVNLTINNLTIEWEDESGTGKLNKNEVTDLIELKRLFLIRIKSGMSIVIPKKSLSDTNSFVNLLCVADVKLVDETQWEWK